MCSTGVPVPVPPSPNVQDVAATDPSGSLEVLEKVHVRPVQAEVNEAEGGWFCGVADGPANIERYRHVPSVLRTVGSPVGSPAENGSERRAPSVVDP